MTQNTISAGSHCHVVNVQRGDTLYAYSKRTGVSIKDIQEDNAIEDPDVIEAGTRIVIEFPQGTECCNIHEDDTAYKAAEHYLVSSAGRTIQEVANNLNKDSDLLKLFNKFIDNPNNLSGYASVIIPEVAYCRDVFENGLMEMIYNPDNYFETAKNISFKFSPEENFKILLRNKENGEKNAPTLEEEKFLWFFSTGNYILNTNNTEISYSDLTKYLNITRQDMDVLDGKDFTIFSQDGGLTESYLPADTRLLIRKTAIPNLNE